jgi:hypothetical protein
MSIVKAGRYNARVVDHGISETKAGDPQVAIRFAFETPEGERELTYYGSFKEKALEHTIKALVTCGLQGSNPAGALEINKEVSIVVEVDKDFEGHDRNVVRWVNPLGSGMIKKIDPSKAAALLERYSGAVMAFKEKTGVKPSNGGFDPDEPIPF